MTRFVTEELKALLAALTGPVESENRRSDVALRILEGSADPRGLLAACVPAVAATRGAMGSFVALQIAKRTPPGQVLDPSIDLIANVLAPRKFTLPIWERVPAERRAPIMARCLAEQPLDDDPNHVAFTVIQVLDLAPEATTELLAYLAQRKALRHVEPGGKCAVAFAKVRAEVPRVAKLADAFLAARPPRRAKAKAKGAEGPFTFERLRSVSDAQAASELDGVSQAQLLAAFSALAGKKRPRTFAAAFALDLGRGEPAVATHYGVSSRGEKRFDFWTFFEDTGVVFEVGTSKQAPIEWSQGCFEATTAASESLAESLDRAWRSRA